MAGVLLVIGAPVAAALKQLLFVFVAMRGGIMLAVAVVEEEDGSC